MTPFISHLILISKWFISCTHARPHIIQRKKIRSSVFYLKNTGRRMESVSSISVTGHGAFDDDNRYILRNSYVTLNIFVFQYNFHKSLTLINLKKKVTYRSRTDKLHFHYVKVLAVWMTANDVRKCSLSVRLL